MITINGTEIAERTTEFGILWADGDESWDVEGSEEEIRDVAWACPGATVIRRHVFVSVPEVAE